MQASGAVGLAAMQLAAAHGCTVVGTAGTEAGMAAVRASGGLAFNHRTDGYLQEALAALGDGRKFNVVLEMSAHTNLVSDVGVLAKGGSLVIVVSKDVSVPFNPRLLMVPEISVMGTFLGSSTADEMKATHTALFTAMSKGTLKPVVGMVLPLEEAAKAHIEVMTPSSGGATGNIVLQVRDP